jgi:hypothetical protein
LASVADDVVVDGAELLAAVVVAACFMPNSGILIEATDKGDCFTEPGVIVGSSSMFFINWLP